MSAGSITLGGNLSIAVGPLGRNGEATGSLNTSGKVAAMLVSLARYHMKQALIRLIILLRQQVQLLEDPWALWWHLTRRFSHHGASRRKRHCVQI